MIWNFKIELCEETDPDWSDDQKKSVPFEKKPLLFVWLTPRSRSVNPFVDGVNM